MKKSSIHSPIFLVLSVILFSAQSIHIPTLKETQTLDQISQAFNLIYESTNPAVISIKAQNNSTESYGAHNHFEFHSEIFNRFFGQMPQPSPQKNAGSGFFCSADGHIMTNAHVVNNCDKITIVLHDGQEVDAILVGSDPHTDIALLKIAGNNIYLPPLSGENISLDDGSCFIKSVVYTGDSATIKSQAEYQGAYSNIKAEVLIKNSNIKLQSLEEEDTI